MDIKNVYLEEGWDDVLSAIPSGIRSLTLKRVDLCSHGETLGSTLRNLNDIQFLNLGYSEMTGNELIGVLIKLSQSNPQLKGLVLDGNDLSSHGEQFVEVVVSLPKYCTVRYRRLSVR